MFPHRATILILAALFAAGFSSAASACCGWGARAPIAYAPFGYGHTGCGGCGAPTAAAVFAQPVAPALPPVPLPTWTAGCGCACGCRTFFTPPLPAVELYPVAPAPIYVTNQGPDFTGPGIMVPYHTWTRPEGYVTRGGYGFHGYGFHGYGFHGYGYGWRSRTGFRYGLHRPVFAPRAHIAFRRRFFGHPFYRRTMPVARPGMGHLYR